ncbi:recombinase family protein [uncultured Alistipes sp.]|jgi:DNA invertase Pin-like site-specific DNA recombinase|uniref:recombinase family protein n=1 Tax=uncultured Alistipes sp. TaxID=538949 RepID=UPI00272C5FE0|nr:recombinase family protein [uncultured Alistipes sp.]
MTYGYCRVSTPKQSIDRQVRNIRAAFPESFIVQEVYTGTAFQGRRELEKILAKVRPGDTIVFDSVSRMSRDAEGGFRLYEELFRKGVNLVFLKERHIDTDTYKRAIETGIGMTGTSVDLILEGVNRYLMELAREQIRLAFEQAQKEVDDMRQRTREGLVTARLNGKQVGQPRGAKLVTKKSVKAKAVIREYSKDFGGPLRDPEVMRLSGVAKKAYYKYKRELREEDAAKAVAGEAAVRDGTRKEAGRDGR